MSKLFLLFRVGQERYGIETTSIVEVIPRVEFHTFHGASQDFVGKFNYQGRVVPVMDICKVLSGKASQDVLSTRIIIINLAHQENSEQLLGLMVEQVTETLSGEKTTPVHDHIPISQASFLGKTLLHKAEIIQCLDTQKLACQYNQTLKFSGVDTNNHLATETGIPA